MLIIIKNNSKDNALGKKNLNISWILLIYIHLISFLAFIKLCLSYCVRFLNQKPKYLNTQHLFYTVTNFFFLFSSYFFFFFPTNPYFTIYANVIDMTVLCMVISCLCV